MDKNMKRRIEEAVRVADGAFWQAIADRFPEAATGDFDPAMAAAFREAEEIAVVHWVMQNVSNPALVAGRTFRIAEDEGTIRVTFTEEPRAPRDELAPLGFGWSDTLGVWVRLGGEVGREVAWSLARQWFAAEDCPPDEMPDPSAGVETSAAEHNAINIALDEAERRYTCSEASGDEQFPFSQLVAENAHDEDVIAFLAREAQPLSVGASCTYYGGAGGDTTFTRVR